MGETLLLPLRRVALRSMLMVELDEVNPDGLEIQHLGGDNYRLISHVVGSDLVDGPLAVIEAYLKGVIYGAQQCSARPF